MKLTIKNSDDLLKINYDNYVGYKFNGMIYDFHENPKINDEIELIERDSVFGQDIIRHSCAHILAQSLQNLYKNVNFGIGPTTENGFFYDFVTDYKISSDDFEKIEQEMNHIINSNYEIKKTYHTKLEAINILNDPIKNEIIEHIETDIVSIYSQHNYKDLCKGPHVKYTKNVGLTFKLTNISQIIWKNKLMQRIEGVAFANDELMKSYEIQEKHKHDHDHRNLGKKLDLFSLLPISPGMVFWHTKGLWIYNKIKSYLRSITESHYNEVQTPPIYKIDLWKKTGHFDKYKENMYIIDDDLALKPMSCPAHTLMFQMEPRSYRDLPLRFSEFGNVFRNEDKGGILGLKRARYFCQDDAHIFCTKFQIKSEIIRILDLIDKVYSHFNLTYLLKISTKPENYIGSDDLWNEAETTLIQSVKESNREYVILPGEGAFYGPKIEIHIIDQNKKLWQCGTVQLDFFLGERLNAQYTNESCEKHYPIVIHHALLGSLERFIGLLVEFGLPFNYNPYQVIIIPVSTEHNLVYCEKINEILKSEYECHIMSQNSTLSEKLKKSYELKPKFLIIIGNKEQQQQEITIQFNKQKYLIKLDEIQDFIKKFK